MQIVIEIPEDKYADIIRRGRVICLSGYEEMIANGTPLPKGHGDLVDLEELTHKFWDGNYMEIHKDDLSKIKAIIPAEQLAEWLKDYKRMKEQEPILDKIRAEIEAIIGEHNWDDYDFCSGLICARKILDKYKGESEQE